MTTWQGQRERDCDFRHSWHSSPESLTSFHLANAAALLMGAGCWWCVPTLSQAERRREAQQDLNSLGEKQNNWEHIQLALLIQLHRLNCKQEQFSLLFAVYSVMQRHVWEVQQWHKFLQTNCLYVVRMQGRGQSMTSLFVDSASAGDVSSNISIFWAGRKKERDGFGGPSCPPSISKDGRCQCFRLRICIA